MTEEKTDDVKNAYDHLIVEEKNKYNVCCTKCPSKILSSTMGKYTKVEVSYYIINRQFNQTPC